MLANSNSHGGLDFFLNERIYQYLYQESVAQVLLALSSGFYMKERGLRPGRLWADLLSPLSIAIAVRWLWMTLLETRHLRHFPTTAPHLRLSTLFWYPYLFSWLSCSSRSARASLDTFLASSSAWPILTFAAFGILFSARAQEMPNAMVPMNLVRLPMLFVSGVFVPLEAMPGFLRPIAYLMPLTYAVDAMRQTVLGPLEPLMLLGDMAALSLFLTLFLGAATMALRRDIC